MNDRPPKSQYGSKHRRARNELLEGDPMCAHCGERVATIADHVPPIALHSHQHGSGCCEYVPSCHECSMRQSTEVRRLLRRSPGAQEVTFAEPEASPGPGSDLWSVPWLADLLEVPEGATWPRWMSAPHPAAVGSLGAEFERFVADRSGKSLRWWQRLVARRILEVDAEGRLVWLSWLLSVARQVGKSFLMLELLIFATVHCGRFWRADGVLYTARVLTASEGVFAPAIRWADESDGWRSYKARGSKSIIHLPTDLELRVRSTGSSYGTTNGLAVVDESWDVKRSDLEEGVRPTLLDAGGMLGLVSTAHRKATSLMLNERARGFEQLGNPSTRLVVEWGADRELELDDRAGWRQASPYWSSYREELIADALDAALSGEVLDPDEPDPIKAFEAQYLNRWPIRQTRRGPGDPLFEPGGWAGALHTDAVPRFQRVAAIADNFGRGSSVVVAGLTAGEQIAVSGSMFETRAEGWRHLSTLTGSVELVLIEAQLAHEPAIAQIPAITELFGPVELRRGLGGLRDLLAAGDLVHDGSPDLAGQILEARLRNGASGLAITSRGRHDAVRAMAGAVIRVQRSLALGTVEVL